MKVYIVRHGEVLHNLLKQYNSKDEDLTETGINQAIELKEKIKDLKFDIVISSPLIRTKHTAEIISNGHKIIYDDRLKERDCGSLSGKSLDVTNREEYWNYYSTIQYGTSENIKTFFERVYEFLDELKTKNYESVLIVAHSGISKAFKSYFEGIQDGKFLSKGLKNCEIKESIDNLRKTKHLDASQLIKHILGLKSNYDKNFTLLYLWYDVPGTEGYEHRQEIEAFASIAKADGINFRHITYQKVIENLDKKEYKNIEKFEEYINYLEERYKNKE
jgi:broad specificity phosphatase PhoE